MDDTTIDTLDQADEEILTYIVSDEALEAAAVTERKVRGTNPIIALSLNPTCC